MKLGISTWVWTSPATTEVLESLIPHIAQLGYDVVEIPVEAEGQFDVRRVRAVAEEHGVGISVCAVITSGRDLLVPGESDRGIAYMHWAIDAAEQLGSPAVAGPFYSAVGRCWRATPEERERDMVTLVPILHALGEYASRKSVVIAIETLNRFETSFLNTVEQAIDLVTRINHPSVGLGLDVFHLGIEEKDVAQALRKAGPLLKHVQAAENDRGTPGTGSLPWTDIAATLHDIGYDGRVVIETFSDRVEAIARAAAIWRPLFPDSDSIAREGLAFLRPLLGQS